MAGRRVQLVVGALAGAVLLGGCGLFGSDDEPGPTNASEPTEEQPTEQQTPDGPTPEDLAEQLVEAAQAQADAAVPVGSATGTGSTTESLTIEVLAVQRLEGRTLVRMRWSGEGGASWPAAFISPRDFNQSFARSLALVDRQVSQSRYEPWHFEDYRPACLCPYFPLRTDPTPQTVTAVYPPLPEGVTAVDLDANGFLTVLDLPVDG